MKRTVVAFLAAVALATTHSEAAVIHYTSALAPEAIGATGTGSVDVWFDNVAHTLKIEADFSGLSGVTTVSHIHCCTAVPGTGTVGVAVTPGTLPGFPAGVSGANYQTTLDLTLATNYTAGFLGGLTPLQAEDKLATGMAEGRAYFNVHSSTFGGGEIRGFLQEARVPEPGSLALLGLGLAGAAIVRRRRG